MIISSLVLVLIWIPDEYLLGIQNEYLCFWLLLYFWSLVLILFSVLLNTQKRSGPAVVLFRELTHIGRYIYFFLIFLKKFSWKHPIKKVKKTKKFFPIPKEIKKWIDHLFYFLPIKLIKKPWWFLPWKKKFFGFFKIWHKNFV